jgi:4-amino-4-deoxy-L-arabinose transferase-like glycosyltransferase
MWRASDGVTTPEPEPSPVGRRWTTAALLYPRLILPAILVIGLAVRIAWAVTQVSVISPDGTEYAAMAEHLAHQRALIGIYDGPAIIYAPLYPILIAAVMRVIPNSELAGQVVSLASGTALIALIFLIAHRVYGRRTAVIAATLVAIHPLLIALSASVYNETLYLTLWALMAYWALRALELQRRRDALMLGISVGLLYLSRVEAIAYVPFLSVALCLAGVPQKRRRTALVHIAIVCAAFLAVASPYVAYLDRQTHHLRFEAKWDINYTIARNRLAGKNQMEANWGVGRDLTVEGPLLSPFQFSDFTPYSNGWREGVGSLVSMAKLNAHAMYHNLLERQFGSPIVWMLIIFGWCCTPWTNRRLRDEALLIGLAGSILAAAFTSASGEVRYLFALGPVLLLWCGNGLRQLADWITGSELMADRPASQRARIAVGLQVGVTALMVAISIGGVRDDGYFATERGDEAAAARDAGVWLRQQPNPSKRIAVRLPVVAYYAKGTLIAFPYADPETTLRYIAKTRVDFIVLEGSDASNVPTAGEWIAHGIPDPRARLVYDKTTGTNARVVIYEWRETVPTPPLRVSEG